MLHLHVLVSVAALPAVLQAAPIAVQDEDKPKPALEGLRQPGDDQTFELPDESSSLDPSNAEARSWYMAGIMAQQRGDLEEALKAFQKAEAADPKAAAPLRAQAILLVRMRRQEEGIRVATRAIAADPDDFRTRLQLAVVYATSAGRIPDAIVLTNEALQSKTLKKTDREYIGLHELRGRLCILAQDIDAASESYAVLLEALERPEDFGLGFREHQSLLKDRATGYETTGRVLLQAKRLELAIKAFEALDRVENQRPGEHHLLLAIAHEQLLHHDAAEKALDKYFESGRRSSDSLGLLRKIYDDTGRSDKLADRVRQLRDGASDGSAVTMFLGRLLLSQDRMSEAEEEFQKLLNDTGDADAYLGLIQVRIAQKDALALIATVNRAARSRIRAEELAPLGPDLAKDSEFCKALATEGVRLWKEKPTEIHPVVTYFCAAAARAAEDLEAEGELLKATLEQDPDRRLAIQTLQQYGQNLIQRDDTALAARVYSRLASTPGLSPNERIDALYRLGWVESDNENNEAALAASDAALRLAPDVPDLHYQRGIFQYRLDDLPGATESLRTVITQYPQATLLGARARIALASIQIQQDHLDQAITTYEEILKTEGVPDEILRSARLALSAAYVQKDDLPNGERILEELYAVDQSDPGVNNDLGYLYADQGKNLEQAEKMIRIAVESQPENSAYLDSLGWVLYRLGRFDEALETMKKANSNPEHRDSTIMEHLGDVHEALKQSDEARASWQEALTIESEAKKPDQKVVERLKMKLQEK
ncbi:MAG: tetratricopeptide repeat protein [Planctomycetaceae bacterium]|nr:tetratricopeptide repeat protein [Planctomycetaceae bacterium]